MFGRTEEEETKVHVNDAYRTIKDVLKVYVLAPGAARHLRLANEKLFRVGQLLGMFENEQTYE